MSHEIKVILLFCLALLLASGLAHGQFLPNTSTSATSTSMPHSSHMDAPRHHCERGLLAEPDTPTGMLNTPLQRRLIIQRGGGIRALAAVMGMVGCNGNGHPESVGVEGTPEAQVLRHWPATLDSRS